MINITRTTNRLLKTALESQPEAYRDSDLGTPETQQRGIVVSINEMGQKVARRRTQQPIDYYYNRGIINEKQYAAAQRLKNDYDISGLGTYIKSSANFEVNGVNERFVDKQIDAKKRYQEAIKVLDWGQRRVIEWIVLDDGYMKDFSAKAEKGEIGDCDVAAGWGDVLSRAMDRLATFYGIK